MKNFIEFEYMIINLNEIMYIEPEYDMSGEVCEYHIVMKDQHTFILPLNEYTDKILFLIKEQLSIISCDDYLD